MAATEGSYMFISQMRHKTKTIISLRNILSGDASVSTVNRSILRDLNFTYKRIKRRYSERFTHVNVLYSKAYIDFCQTKGTHQIKFIDERGFQLSGTKRTYGHLYKGKSCLEVGNTADRNLALKLLIGLDSVLYYKFVDGTSYTHTF